MLWLLIFVACVLLLIFSGILFFLKDGVDEFESLAIFCLFLFLIFGFVNILIILDGLYTLPSLIEKRETVLALKSEIETIRMAYYNTKSGALIGGSLDNLQQSKILSEYISNYARAKANYNSELEKCKNMYNNKVFYWFGNTMFWDKDIMKLDKI